jgi:hypothetical protein
LRRFAAVLSWVSAVYLLTRVAALYLELGGTRRHHVEAAAFVFLASLLPLVSSRLPPDSDALLDTTEDDISWWRWTPLLLVACSLVLHWNLLWTGLFSDDYVLADAARQGRLTVWRDLFRPMIFVLWRPVVALTDSPGAWLHALNLVLHGANAALVAALAHRLLRRRSSGLIAGLLFLVCPAGLEAVAWASGLQDVLMTTFVLAFLTLATTERQGWWMRGLGLLALVGGLVTKETAVAAPLLAALVSAGAPTRQARRRTLIAAALSLGVVGAFAVIRLAILPLPGSYEVPATRYAVKELVVRPFATLVVPLREEETRSAPLVAIALVAATVFLLRGAAARWDRHSARLWRTVVAGAMVLVAVLPVLSYFYVDPDLAGSRYLYLAQAGWTIAVASMLETVSRGLRVMAPLSLSILTVWVVIGGFHKDLWVEAGRTRDRLLSAATATAAGCAATAVHGLPSTVRGVPLFLNGFPEAARQHLPGPIRVAPAARAPGECRLSWDGERFVRD